MVAKRKAASLEGDAAHSCRQEKKENPPASRWADQSSRSNSMAPFQTLPINKVYRLIEPGPVLLVTTGSLAHGDHNVMTIGFHMMMQHEAPPLIGVCIGPWDASYGSLMKYKQCVLAVPSVDMAEATVDIGNCSAAAESAGEGHVDKWTRFALGALKAQKVKAPLVGNKDVLANIECVVEDTRMVSPYSMWVLRAVKAWVNQDKVDQGAKTFHHRGDGTFVVDGEVLNLQERMVKWKQYQD